jgi:hypothetical protein
MVPEARIGSPPPSLERIVGIATEQPDTHALVDVTVSPHGSFLLKVLRSSGIQERGGALGCAPEGGFE